MFVTRLPNPRRVSSGRIRRNRSYRRYAETLSKPTLIASVNIDRSTLTATQLYDIYDSKPINLRAPMPTIRAANDRYGFDDVA